MSEISVKEIKKKLDNLGINYDGIFEKSDLLKLLQTSTSSPAISMSVSDLKDLVRSLAGRPSQCSEKIDLFNLARELIGDKKTCSICLDLLLVRPSDSVVRLTCCGAILHTGCVAAWILRSTQDGIYPHKCPACPKGEIDESFVVGKIITPANDTVSGRYLRYVSAVEKLKELRAVKKGRSAMTPEEEYQLHSQGFRKCPQCGAWIDKRPSMEAFGITLAQGCDKMTCRCGCKFCFNCGALNAQCNCTSSDHGFFEHEEVINQYPRSQIGARDILSNLL